MRVRVIKDVPLRYSKGAELDMFPALCKRLIDLGIAEAIDGDGEKPAKAAKAKKKAAKKKA